MIDALRNGRFGSETFAVYENRWRGLLGRNLALGSLFRRLFGRMMDGDIDRLFRILQREIHGGRLTEKVSFDWHHDLIFFLLRHPTIVRLLLRSYWKPRPEAQG